MAAPAPNGLTAREIAQMLNEQVDTLAPLLLPNGRAIGPYFCVGSVDGEPGDSLKIHLRGLKRGKWSDFSRSSQERGGSGDMLTIVELTMAGGDKGEAVRWAKGWLGIGDGIDPGKLERQRRRAAESRKRAEDEAASDAERRRRNAEGLWQHATPLGEAPPGLAYFKGRGIDFAQLGRIPRAMRYRGDVRHFETGQTYPAILSAMIGLDGRHMATHATFIERLGDGSWVKLRGVESAKLIYGAPKGAHIPLSKGTRRETLRLIPPGTPVEVSEGIEDGLSVALAFPELRVLAAGTLGNIGALRLPATAGDLTIIAQRDAPGSKAEATLEKCIAEQQLAGVRDGSQRRVLLRWPGEGFKDFNDQLRGVRMVRDGSGCA